MNGRSFTNSTTSPRRASASSTSGMFVLRQSPGSFASLPARRSGPDRSAAPRPGQPLADELERARGQAAPSPSPDIRPTSPRDAPPRTPGASVAGTKAVTKPRAAAQGRARGEHHRARVAARSTHDQDMPEGALVGLRGTQPGKRGQHGGGQDPLARRRGMVGKETQVEVAEPADGRGHARRTAPGASRCRSHK